MNLKLIFFFLLCLPLYAANIVETTTQHRFSPDRIQIRVGDTVEFQNRTSIKHTVTADATLAADPSHIIVPEGAESFHSGPILPGEIYTRVFGVAGLYQYVCLPHERHGMIGQIEVIEND